MSRRALLAAVFVIWGMAGAASAQVIVPKGLVLGYEPDLTAYLLNNTDAPLSFDGYQITSETKQLDPVGWKSIQDQIPNYVEPLMQNFGAGILGFGEAGPSPASLAELNISGAATIQPNAKLHLGKPFGNGGFWVEFFYKTFGTPTQAGPQALYIEPVPEPSTLILAGLAGLGLVAVRVRSKR